jgi:hypothetical protein
MSTKTRLILLGTSLASITAGTAIKNNETLSTVLFSVGMLALIMVMFRGGGC